MKIRPRQGREMGMAAIVCGVALIGLTTLGCATRGERPPVALMALDGLWREFNADPKMAEKQWSGQVIDVTGVVESHERTKNSGFVNLKCFNPGVSRRSMNCEFDPLAIAQIDSLSDGQQIIVRGEFVVRRGLSIPDSVREMTHCSIVTGGSSER